MDESERRTGERRTDVLELLERLLYEVTELKGAFPAGDPDGHRRYHEAVIKRAEERAEFYLKLRLELAKWGLLGFLGWLFIVGWGAFLKGPK